MPRSSSPHSVTGFVDLAKPEGMTSSDAVCIVRGVLSRVIGGRQKTGHLGTLDPLAEGVLPVALGKATALFDFLAFKTKEYIARFTFGKTTDTLDRGGHFSEETGRVPDADEVAAAAKKFVGDIMQVPPAYSAKSVGGRRAYDLARKGVEVELTARRVHIDDIRLIAAEGDEFTFSVVCGGGTYIRSLARDIAAELGTCAYMSALKRTRSGIFTLEDAVTLEEFRAAPEKHIIPAERALDGLPRLVLSEKEEGMISNGVPVPSASEAGDHAVVFSESGRLLGLGQADERGMRLKVRL